jgi:hypothetical protein
LYSDSEVTAATASSVLALRVSSYNVNHLLVEPAQLSPPPLHVTAEGGLLWFEQFHLQIPLDNLEDHSYSIVELVRKANTASSSSSAANTESETVLAWTKLSLDRASITSESKALTFYAPPVNANAAASSGAVHSTLFADISIIRR